MAIRLVQILNWLIKYADVFDKDGVNSILKEMPHNYTIEIIEGK